MPILAGLIETQLNKNKFLKTEIAKVDKEIEEIQRLKEQTAALLARKQVIEQLQASRSQMVHLFDELVRTIPEGVRLASIKQNGDVFRSALGFGSTAGLPQEKRREQASVARHRHRRGGGSFPAGRYGVERSF